MGQGNQGGEISLPFTPKSPSVRDTDCLWWACNAAMWAAMAGSIRSLRRSSAARKRSFAGGLRGAPN